MVPFKMLVDLMSYIFHYTNKLLQLQQLQIKFSLRTILSEEKLGVKTLLKTTILNMGNCKILRKYFLF